MFSTITQYFSQQYTPVSSKAPSFCQILCQKLRATATAYRAITLDMFCLHKKTDIKETLISDHASPSSPYLAAKSLFSGMQKKLCAPVQTLNHFFRWLVQKPQKDNAVSEPLIISQPTSISTEEVVKKLEKWAQRGGEEEDRSKAKESLLNNWESKDPVLKLANCSLKALPKGVLEYCTHVTTLDVSCNQFSEMPWVISQMTNLEDLDLTDNQLSKLSSNIGALTQLKQLSVSNNQLTSLPKTFGQLSNLTIFYADKNQFEKFPKPLQALTQLQELSLDANKIEMIPAWVGLLSSLSVLSLVRNQLKEISVNIGYLNQLTSLNLSHNPQLRFLPHTLVHLQQLRYLSVSYNKILQPIGKIIKTLASFSLNTLYANDIPVGSMPNPEETSITNSDGWETQYRRAMQNPLIQDKAPKKMRTHLLGQKLPTILTRIRHQF